MVPEVVIVVHIGHGMYVYRQTDEKVFTVGFYNPLGKWMPESDYPNSHDAAERVAWLNGSEKWET